MPTQIQIGDKTVEVGDEFTKLTPEQQQFTANDIAKQLGISPDTPIDSGNWRTGDLLPIKRNVDTGEWKWDVPNFINGIIDSVQLPGQVMRGEVNPNTQEGFDRAMGLAMMGVGADIPAGSVVRRGMSGTAGAVGKAEEVTTEPLAKGFGQPKESPLPGGTSTKIEKAPPPPTMKGDELDQTLDNMLNSFKQNAPATLDTSKLPKAAKYTGTLGVDEGFVAKPAELALTPYKGEVPVSGTYGEPGIQLKLRQGERLNSAAQQDDIANFGTQLENSFALHGNKLDPKITEQMTGMQGAIAALDAEKTAALTEKLNEETMAKTVAKEAKKPNFGDKLFEWWLNWGLLSGPQTHAANMMANQLVQLWGLGEESVAAGISKVTGSGLTAKSVVGRAVAGLESIPEALRAAGTSFRTEKELFDTGKLEFVPAVGGKMGGVARLPGRALSAEDAYFKTVALRQEINAQAINIATKEDRKGGDLARRITELKANPTPEMLKAATDYAKHQTFTNPLGPAGQAIQRILGEHKALRVIVPFFRTPVNLLKYPMERLPTAVMFKKVRNDLRGFNGAQARDRALARMTMGTGVAAWAVHEALKGNITGSGSLNPDKRRIQYANGFQPYSIKVGDTWYSYGRLEPLGTILGLASDFTTLSQEMKPDEINSGAALIVTAIANQLTNKTWLKGPAQLAEAFNDPERFGTTYIQDLLGTMVPNVVSQYAKTQDPYMRANRSLKEAKGAWSDTSPEGALSILLDGVRARIPGVRETMSIRRDSFGEPIKSQGGLGPDLISPIYETAAKNDPVAAEILRTGAFPGSMQRQIKGTPLTQDEWNFYTETSGVAMRKSIAAVMENDGYKKMNDAAKKMVLTDVINKSRDIGRTATLRQFPDLILRIAQDKAKARLGLVQQPEVQQ